MDPATPAISQRLRQPRQKAGRVVSTVSASCPIQSVTPSHGASPSKYARKGWNVSLKSDISMARMSLCEQ